MKTKEIHFILLNAGGYELIKMVNTKINQVIGGIPLQLGYVYNEGSMETLHEEIMKMPNITIVMTKGKGVA